VARTQAADYDQRREAIVAAAADLYARRGFPAASVADLAAACGVSKSLIYHYFPSKEDILFAVMASHIEDLRTAVRAVDSLQAAPAVKLRALARRFMALYSGAAERQKVLLNELGHLPPDRCREITAWQRELVRAVEALLLAIRPDLAARPGGARPVAMLFFGMINWTHTWYDPAGPAAPAAVADAAVDLVLGGLPALA
jgi:AcrR family transcriptional regulator